VVHRGFHIARIRSFYMCVCGVAAATVARHGGVARSAAAAAKARNHRRRSHSVAHSSHRRKVKFTGQTFHDRLQKILDEFPIMSQLHPFFAYATAARRSSSAGSRHRRRRVVLHCCRTLCHKRMRFHSYSTTAHRVHSFATVLAHLFTHLCRFVLLASQGSVQRACLAPRQRVCALLSCLIVSCNACTCTCVCVYRFRVGFVRSRSLQARFG